MSTASLRQPPGVSTAEWCRQNNIQVGTRLIGDEGYGPATIVITAIGEQRILARCIFHGGSPCKWDESTWTLVCRDWVIAPSGTGDTA